MRNKAVEIEIIRKCGKQLKFSSHAKDEMLYEESGEITEDEIKEAIADCEIIERYLQDKPYPSFPLFGQTKQKRPPHIVCAPIEVEKVLVIITVYEPDSSQWIDYRRRK